MKPRVTYSDAAAPPTVGESACVRAVDHPHFAPQTWLWTSPVLSEHENGSFETRNTVYIPGVVDDPVTMTALEQMGIGI